MITGGSKILMSVLKKEEGQVNNDELQGKRG